jgi:two-component system CheB/CheR fusion protein
VVKVRDQPLTGKTQSAVEKVCVLLRSQTGHDFSLYKRSTVYRRIERRMGLHQLDSIADYVRYLQESPQETQLLFKELLIGVTSFFRDPAAWDLRKKVIPEILAAHSPAGHCARGCRDARPARKPTPWP